MPDATTTLTLAAFLSARLAEDEAAALGGLSSQADPESGWGYEGRALTPHVGIIHEAIQAAHIIRWHPVRVLAEVAAKRAVLEYATGHHTSSPEGMDIVAILAAVYSEHEDYDESWRP